MCGFPCSGISRISATPGQPLSATLRTAQLQGASRATAIVSMTPRLGIDGDVEDVMAKAAWANSPHQRPVDRCMLALAAVDGRFRRKRAECALGRRPDALAASQPAHWSISGGSHRPRCRWAPMHTRAAAHAHRCRAVVFRPRRMFPRPGSCSTRSAGERGGQVLAIVDDGGKAQWQQMAADRPLGRGQCWRRLSGDPPAVDSLEDRQDAQTWLWCRRISARQGNRFIASIQSAGILAALAGSFAVGRRDIMARSRSGAHPHCLAIWQWRERLPPQGLEAQ